MITAPTQAAEQKAFSALVAAGYEIKAVMLVPMEIAKREQADINGDTVAVTLQKGGSVAVCYFGFANWVSLNKTSLGNAAQCAIS